MTMLDAAPRTLPARTTTPQPRRVGDVIVVGTRRWKIRALNRKTGQVVLSSTNTVNADIWWNTTLANLPEEN